MNCKKEPVDPEQLKGLLQQVSRVRVARGKKLLEFDPGRDLEEILNTAIGRSGTLRAPTLRQEQTLVVGFHLEAYQQLIPVAVEP